MSPSQRVLNRVSLNGRSVHRLSAVLHAGASPRSGLSDAPWWIYLACESLSAEYQLGDASMRLSATTVSGQVLEAAVAVIDRRDDGYGTVLILGPAEVRRGT
jgi:hypothetical protein